MRSGWMCSRGCRNRVRECVCLFRVCEYVDGCAREVVNDEVFMYANMYGKSVCMYVCILYSLFYSNGSS